MKVRLTKQNKAPRPRNLLRRLEKKKKAAGNNVKNLALPFQSQIVKAKKRRKKLEILLKSLL